MPPLYVALALSLLLAAALATLLVRERRRIEMNERLRRVLGGAPDQHDDLRPRLELGKSEWDRRLDPLPGWLRQRIENVATKAGKRVKPLHLVLTASAGAIVGGWIADRLFGLGSIAVVFLGTAAALGAVLFLIDSTKARYDRAFLRLFPDALDQIVRAIRAGLPVSEGLASVGHEVADPVGAEFRRIHDEMTIAMDVEKVLQRAAARIRITDFQFFVASIAMHRATGGNLAETLSNLSSTIRRRNEVRLKVRALSSEGRISALMLSVMPLVLGSALYLLNRSYIALLLQDPRGHKIMLAAAVELTVGILVMRSMIRRVMR
jgi:tight adherence protein B